MKYKRSSGQSLPHESARGHVTGTAAFIDDFPKLAGELMVDFVGAPIAAGRIRSIDTSLAEEIARVSRLGNLTAAHLADATGGDPSSARRWRNGTRTPAGKHATRALQLAARSRLSPG